MAVSFSYFLNIVPEIFVISPNEEWINHILAQIGIYSNWEERDVPRIDHIISQPAHMAEAFNRI